MKGMLALLALLLLLLSGCAANPVTGESELALVSESSEIEMGSKQYAPTRQTQGGDYILDPDLTRYVQRVGQRLAAVSDRKLPYEFVVLNDSTPNAWALPGGKIAINRGLLLELNNEAELAAVLGHEIVHAAARHGAQGMERSLLLKSAIAIAGAAAAASDSRYTGLAVGAAAIGANLVNQRYSREAELESDHYGMIYMQRAGYDPRAAINLQETFVRLAEGRSENWLQGMFASHPPSRERVEKNRQLAAELDVQGGRLGRDAYRKATAGLRHNKAAYAAYDKGRQRLKKAPEEALRLADKAISIEPREALFYGLRGDALAQQDDLKGAKAAYNQAVKRNPGYFQPYLNRGRVRALLNDPAGARRDLQQSLKLLPTADANYLLGRLALADGERREARDYFKVAAGSNSGVGKAATKQLLRLELAQNAARYLVAEVAVDGGGTLQVQITNRTRVAVGNLVVLVGRKDARGRIYRGSEHRIRQILGPGQRYRFSSGIRGLGSRAQAKRYAARVLQAEVAGTDGHL